jgi:P27 family predicted phage terminase small subunit
MTPSPCGVAANLVRRDGYFLLVVSAPPDLSQSAQRRWNDLIADLCVIHDVREPAESDLIILAGLLRAQDELDAVQEAIKRGGTTVAGSRGQLRAHPLLSVERGLREEIARGLERLWLTPRHRSAARLVGQANAIMRR